MLCENLNQVQPNSASPMTKNPPLLLTSDGATALLTFNRPEVYNALDAETETSL